MAGRDVAEDGLEVGEARPWSLVVSAAARNSPRTAPGGSRRGGAAVVVEQVDSHLVVAAGERLPDVLPTADGVGDRDEHIAGRRVDLIGRIPSGEAARDRADGRADAPEGGAVGERGGDRRAGAHRVEQQPGGEGVLDAGRILGLDQHPRRVVGRCTTARRKVRPERMRCPCGGGQLAQAERQEGVGVDGDVEHVVEPQFGGRRAGGGRTEAHQAAPVAPRDDRSQLGVGEEAEVAQDAQFAGRDVPLAVGAADLIAVEDEDATAVEAGQGRSVEQPHHAAGDGDLEGVAGRQRRHAAGLDHPRRRPLTLLPAAGHVVDAAQAGQPIRQSAEGGDGARVGRRQRLGQRRRVVGVDLRQRRRARREGVGDGDGERRQQPAGLAAGQVERAGQPPPGADSVSVTSRCVAV